MTRSALVFIRTSPYRPDSQYSGAVVAHVAHPTDSTQTLCAAVLAALDGIYRPGYKYAKAGVCLLDLVNMTAAGAQGDLFGEPDLVKHQAATGRLMRVVDTLNHQFGRQVIGPASAVSAPGAPWHMRQQRMTPAYTTDWEQVVNVWR